MVIVIHEINEDEEVACWHPCLANLSRFLFQNFFSTFIYNSNRHQIG